MPNQIGDQTYEGPIEREEPMVNDPFEDEPVEVPRDALHVLIVDDDKSIRDNCREVSEDYGCKTFVAENAGNAFKVLESQTVDVVILDLKLPGSNNGLEMLRDIRTGYPQSEVVVISGYATVDSAVKAIKIGAYDYVTKPFGLEEFRLLLERVAAHVRLASENRLLRARLKSKEGFAGMIGRAPEMQKLYRFIAKAANSHHSVLILGESGTGKELVARSIHNCGRFKNKPFIPVDCGSLVPTLIESELFGYVKGAFTGAVQAKDGLLAIANGGTVFFDEIGELPVDLQAKILRAIQEKEIRPVGSTRRIPIDVRILAATNRPLEEAVQRGTFRRDLYFRLNVLTLKIPPLRERKQDIPLLVGHFLERIGRSGGVERAVSDDALRALLEYDWPGNVRELENALDRACALNSGGEIHLEDLPTAVKQNKGEGILAGSGIGVTALADIERQAIFQALEKTHGDKLQAARLLKIGKTTLYRKLKEYGSRY